MKKLLVTIFAVLAVFTATSSVSAEEEILCPQAYGEAVVCGVKHEAVDTGIGENLALLGSGLLTTSGVLVYFKNKASNLVK